MKLIKDIQDILPPKQGRPRKFKSPQQLFDAANEYFEHCRLNPWQKQDFIKSGPNAGQKCSVDLETPYTYQGLCIHLGVNSQYFNEFKEGLKIKEVEEDLHFSVIAKYIHDVISSQRFEGAMVGAFNPLIVSRLEGLTDKQEITATNTNISVNVQDKGLKDKLDEE